MVNTQDLNSFFGYTVNGDIRQRSKDKLAGALHTTDPATAGKHFQAHTPIVKRFGDPQSSYRVVLPYSLRYALKIVGCRACPADDHQDFNARSTLVQTSSEGTKSPASAAARPMPTASVKRTSSSRKRRMASRARSSALRPSRAASCANRSSCSGDRSICMSQRLVGFRAATRPDVRSHAPMRLSFTSPTGRLRRGRGCRQGRRRRGPAWRCRRDRG